MKLGIIGAMDCEIALLKNTMQLAHSETHYGREYHIGTIGGIETVVVCCGIGKVNAAFCTGLLIDRFAVTHIINTGVAGGVLEKAGVLDVILSTSVCYHDFTPGILRDNFPFCEEFPCDETMQRVMLKAHKDAKAAGEADYGLYPARIVTGDVFVEDDALKASIKERFAPGCVDMESAAVGQACFICHIPYLALRSLSDTADGGASMSFDQFAEIAANHSADLILRFCELWED